MPGCSTSAAPTSRTFPLRSPSPSCPQAGKPELFIAPEKIDTAARAHLDAFAKLSPPEALSDRIKTLRKAEQARAPRPEHGELLVRARAWWARTHCARARSLSRAQGGEDFSRDQGRARGARRGTAPRWSASSPGSTRKRRRRSSTRSRPCGGSKASGARRNQLREISFDTISGSGPNGAIVHYRVDAGDQPQAARRASCSSSTRGAQYLDGTTDITRTVAIGTPTRGDARALHARAQGPHRASPPRGFPPARAARPRPARAARAVAARPRLRPRHRPRRRQLSLRARGAAAHLQAPAWRRCSRA